MNCEEVQNLLDAYLDGETTQEQVESILGHLERCEDCNREYQSRAEQSAELRTALSPDPEMLARIQSGVFNSLREDETAGSRAENTIETPQLTMPLPVRGQKRSQINWGRIALAMAAGFLLAALLFQPWNHPPREAAGEPEIPTVPAIRTFGTIALATGDVEVKPKDEGWSDWSVQSEVPVEAQLRTGETIGCEIVQQDGASIRIDESSEVTFNGGKNVELNHGRLFVCASDDDTSEPVGFSCGHNYVEIEGNVDVRRTGDSFEFMAVGESARINAAQRAEVIPPGHVARISADSEQVEVTPANDPLLATSWMNPFLQQSTDNAELAERVNQLLAQIGQSKLDHLYEDEIRSLGAPAVDALVAFLRSENPAHQNERQRIKAAQIVSDLATRQHAMSLVDLLEHVDSDVSLILESGLERITGQTQEPEMKVRTPQHWRSIVDEPTGCIQRNGGGRWMAFAEN